MCDEDILSQLAGSDTPESMHRVRPKLYVTLPVTYMCANPEIVSPPRAYLRLRCQAPSNECRSAIARVRRKRDTEVGVSVKCYTASRLSFAISWGICVENFLASVGRTQVGVSV